MSQVAGSGLVSLGQHAVEAMPPQMPTPAPVPAEDLGQKIAKSFVPHVDKLLADLHTRGPALAWAVHLNAEDTAARGQLDALTGKIKAWTDVRAQILAAAGV